MSRQPSLRRGTLLLVMWLAAVSGLEAQKAAPPLQQRFASAWENWAPPDIDVETPAIDAGTECSLATVLKQTSRVVQEMVTNLPKFSATERVEHFEQTSDGKWRQEKPLRFEYLVETQEVRKGMLIVNEMRDDPNAMAKFPARLATLGLPALALVFHPYFADEYEMKCEGLGNFEGYYAWLVHFQQRADKLPRVRSFRVRELIFPLKLKGRAWISADNFQLLHLETDLMEPVSRIRLAREHIAVDYRPVHFRKAGESLWLQQRAEVFMDYRGHHYRRVHTFEDFKLFTVDTGEKRNEPKE